MRKIRRILRLLGTSVVAMICSSLGSAQVRSSHTMLPTSTIAPKEFGAKDYVYTAISGLSFNGQSFFTGPQLSRQTPASVDTHYYATVNIPNGVVIDYIAFDNWNDGTPGIMGLALYENGPHRRYLEHATPILRAGLQHRPDRVSLRRQRGREAISGPRHRGCAQSPHAVLPRSAGRLAKDCEPAAGDCDLQRRADESSALPVHRGAEGVGNYGRLSGEPAALLPECNVDPRPDGRGLRSKALGLHWPY